MAVHLRQAFLEVFQTRMLVNHPHTPICRQLVEIDDDKKLLPFFDKRMGNEVSGDTLGDEFKGLGPRITLLADIGPL